MTDRVDTSPGALRKFGLLFGAITLLLTGYLLYRGNSHWYWALAAAGFFVASGLFARPVLKPVYVAWMKFAFVLGWFNTRLLLGLFFYLIITPMGVMMRLFGKDLLDERIDRSARSYWKKREPASTDPSRYERLF